MAIAKIRRPASCEEGSAHRRTYDTIRSLERQRRGDAPRACAWGSDQHLTSAQGQVGHAAPLSGFLFVLMVAVNTVCGQTETIRVDLKLQTGGEISGLVVDHTELGLVIVNEDTPYVFAWSELVAGCAYGTKRAVLALQRGGKQRLTAEDHFELGSFALRRGRTDLAANEFRAAKRLNREFEQVIKKAFDDYRRQDAGSGARRKTKDYELRITRDELPSLFAKHNAPLIPHNDNSAQVQEVYESFGRKVQEVIGPDVVLIESTHFLIWTDWEPRRLGLLVDWCESMYAALCTQFDLDPDSDIFLAKCPVFAWRSERRFRQFARLFDGYAGTNAIGYTRSIENIGHVHIVLLRKGRLAADFDRFACTLVHEGTHAFMHRLYTSRLIPHWINEGYADLTAERVLGDRCPAGEKASLLARQFARYDWPVTELLHSTGPIDIHQYPVAHSVVSYLEGLDRNRFGEFIKDLKAGATVVAALAANYDNLTLNELEARWRSAIRAADPAFHSPADDTAVLPWSTTR